MSLRGQVVLITGGGRGIGSAIAIECARQEAKVALVSRTERELKAVAGQIEAETGQRPVLRVCDVSDEAAVQAMTEKVAEETGGVDALVAAAGIYGAIGAFDEVSVADWRRTIEVNLMGSMLCARAVIPCMKKRGSGRIVFFVGGGEGPLPRFSAYVASKGAIARLTETLGAELAPHGIFVNAIAPGAVNSGILEELLKAGVSQVGTELYQKALRQKEKGGADPQKSARLAAFLLSARSRGLHGKILSALWDDWEAIDDCKAASVSDIFTLRRRVP